jgi:integrase
MGRKIECLNDPEYFDLVKGVKGIHPKERLIILLFLEAGLRVSEVCNLKVGNLYPNGRAVTDITALASHGKIGEPRNVPASGRLIEALMEYQKYLPKRNRPSGPEDPAFIGLTHRGGMTSRAMEMTVKKWTKEFIGRNVWPHALRHTFATKLMRKTSTRVVQELLGHSNIASTERYMHPNRNDLREAINATFGQDGP